MASSQTEQSTMHTKHGDNVLFRTMAKCFFQNWFCVSIWCAYLAFGFIVFIILQLFKFLTIKKSAILKFEMLLWVKVPLCSNVVQYVLLLFFPFLQLQRIPSDSFCCDSNIYVIICRALGRNLEIYLLSDSFLVTHRMLI